MLGFEPEAPETLTAWPRGDGTTVTPPASCLGFWHLGRPLKLVCDPGWGRGALSTHLVPERPPGFCAASVDKAPRLLTQGPRLASGLAQHPEPTGGCPSSQSWVLRRQRGAAAGVRREARPSGAGRRPPPQALRAAVSAFAASFLPPSSSVSPPHLSLAKSNSGPLRCPRPAPPPLGVQAPAWH